MVSVPKCLLGTVFCCALNVLVVIFSCKAGGIVDQQNNPRLVLKDLSGYSYKNLGSGNRNRNRELPTQKLKKKKKPSTQKTKDSKKVTTHFLVGWQREIQIHPVERFCSFGSGVWSPVALSRQLRTVILTPSEKLE